VPVAALGDGATRTVVLVPSDDAVDEADPVAYHLAVSTDSGATWTVSDGPLGDAEIASADPVSGVVAIFGSKLYRLDGTDAPQLPIDLPATPDLANLCRHGVTQAWMSGDTVVVVDATGATAAPIADAVQGLRLADCNATSALVEEGSMPVRYRRCTGGECKEVFRGATYAYGRPAMLPDGTVVYAAGRGALIALWTEGVAAPTYFKLPRALTLDEIVVWNGVPYALLHEPKDASLALLLVKLA
jgi:hypothetical protein